MPTITGYHHTAIRTRDFDTCIRFYTEVVGLKVRITWGEGDKRAAMIDAGDGRFIEVFARSEDFPTEPGTILHFALRTDDCSGMIEKVRAGGAEVTMEPRDITIDSSKGPVPIKIAFFNGPDGEKVELVESDTL